MSPRSAARYRKFSRTLQPLFSMLDALAIQEVDDAEIWRALGVAPEKIHHTGSLKFDPAGGVMPTPRAEFQEMLDAFGKGRPIVLAASTHAGEEIFIASAIRAAAPHALPVIVPRHAERREEVRNELERAGYHVVLRSSFHVPETQKIHNHAFIIDSTGELRDWTAHATAVIIGKSFLATGGQNPSEAIQAGIPVIFGPHMENFQPLADRLVALHGCLVAHDEASLCYAIRSVLEPGQAEEMTIRAKRQLGVHEGATHRILRLLDAGSHR
jgi:3-deoxy-D-manno-octulosonic-acid transferase